MNAKVEPRWSQDAREQHNASLPAKDVYVEDVALKFGNQVAYLSFHCSQRFNADGSPFVVEIKNWSELYDVFRDFCEQALADV